jgi:hypothetical protein
VFLLPEQEAPEQVSEEEGYIRVTEAFAATVQTRAAAGHNAVVRWMKAVAAAARTKAELPAARTAAAAAFRDPWEDPWEASADIRRHLDCQRPAGHRIEAQQQAFLRAPGRIQTLNRFQNEENRIRIAAEAAGAGLTGPAWLVRSSVETAGVSRFRP